MLFFNTKTPRSNYEHEIYYYRATPLKLDDLSRTIKNARNTTSEIKKTFERFNPSKPAHATREFNKFLEDETGIKFDIFKTNLNGFNISAEFSIAKYSSKPKGHNNTKTNKIIDKLKTFQSEIMECKNEVIQVKETIFNKHY